MAARLGLPHLAEALNQYAQRADEAKMGYLDFLDLVLVEELAVRNDLRFRLRLSRLLHHKTLEDYDFPPARPGPAQGQRPRRPLVRRGQSEHRPARVAPTSEAVPGTAGTITPPWITAARAFLTEQRLHPKADTADSPSTKSSTPSRACRTAGPASAPPASGRCPAEPRQDQNGPNGVLLVPVRRARSVCHGAHIPYTGAGIL